MLLLGNESSPHQQIQHIDNETGGTQVPVCSETLGKKVGSDEPARQHLLHLGLAVQTK